jgi:ubiquinone/menaquinone biosynthesis C-methylase UbiE
LSNHLCMVTTNSPSNCSVSPSAILRTDRGCALERALELIDRVYDIERLLDDNNSLPNIKSYYRQSLIGYLAVQSRAGAIHFAFDGHDFEAQVRIVRDSLQAVHARNVLELGSGLGFNSARLARSAPTTTFTGIDLTPAHVRLARLRGARLGNLSFDQGDMHALRHPEASADVVFAVEAFCYANPLSAAISEVARVVRPGGRFVVIDGFLRRPLHTMQAHEQVAVRLLDVGMAVTRTWTLDDLLATASEHGLMVLRSEDHTNRIRANVNRLARHAGTVFRSPWLAHTLGRALPPLLIRNGITAILAPGVDHLYGYHAVTLQRRHAG